MTPPAPDAPGEIAPEGDDTVAAGGPEDQPLTASPSRAHLRVASSTASLVASNAVIALLGAVALQQLTHTLGESSYGVLVSVLNFISISLLFADLGINVYTGREIARDPSRASEVLGQNLGLRLVLGTGMIPLVVAVGLVAPHSRGQLLEGIAIVSLTIPFEATRAVSVSYYVATIQNYKTALLGVGNQVIYVGGVVLSLHAGFGLTGCFVAYDLSLALTGLVAYLAVRRSVTFAPRLAFGRWRDILRNSFGIGSIQIVNVFYLRTNVLLLTLMTSSKVVGEYGLASTIVTFLLVVPNAFMTSMLPLLVAAPLSRLRRLVDMSAAYMTMVGTLAVAGTVCVAPDLVRELAGPKFQAAAFLLEILGVSVLFTCLTSVFSYASFARDHHHRLLAISVAGLACNVGLDVLLIPHLGAKGAAIATIAIELLILVGTYAIFRARVGPYFSGWSRMARIYAVGGAVTVVGRFGVDRVLSPGLTRLAVGGVGLPLLFLALALALRCFPTPIPYARIAARLRRAPS